MTGVNEQPISEKQGYPRNEEFNPRKGEDNYQLQFLNGKIQLDNAMANAQNISALATVALQTAVTTQQELNKLSLSWMDAREKAQNLAISERNKKD
jgi:hypothetical protein